MEAFPLSSNLWFFFPANFQRGDDMLPCNLLSSSISHPQQRTSAPFLSPNPNPNSSLQSPLHARCFLCRCRRRDSSFDPNAESVRAGRLGFRDESGSGEVGGDFGQGSSRRWWSDGNPDDKFKEEFDSFDDDDDDDEGEQLWDKIWIFKVLKSYGYLLPAIIASILLATGPKAFLMALALPLGQSVISLAIDRLWGGGQEEPRTGPRIRRNPFSTANDFRKQEQDESSAENKKKAVYQSWIATEKGSDDDRGKYSERPSFGGWDELDQQRRQVRWRPPRAESSPKSTNVKMGMLSRKGRYRDAPLFLRLLIAVFPFLGSWIRIL